MQVRANVVAKKYAIAFLNLYIDDLTDQELSKISELDTFLKQNKQFYVYLGIPGVSYLIKQKAVNRVAQELGLCKPLKKLIFILLDHGRIEILDKVLKQIETCYRVFKNIRLFLVTTSHKLIDIEKDKIIEFIRHVTKSKVIAKFMVDEKLICGFRIHSNRFLWERSIQKQLRDVRKFIFKQVGLW